MVRGSNPGSGKINFSSPKRSKHLWVHPASHSVSTGVLSRGIKRPEPEVDHSPPSSAEVNEWSYTFTRHTCHHGVDKENFTFFTVLFCPEGSTYQNMADVKAGSSKLFGDYVEINMEGITAH